MKNKWYWTVAVRYIDGEDESYATFDYDDVKLAYAKFDELRDDNNVISMVIVVYPPEGSYKPSVLLAFSNSWDEDCVKWPDWLD